MVNHSSPYGRHTSSSFYVQYTIGINIFLIINMSCTAGHAPLKKKKKEAERGNFQKQQPAACFIISAACFTSLLGTSMSLPFA
ncbi:hypothetical protein CISIN_1g034830mg [Citrus sinensis]|uniref:Uncharacterized protein n=1 Tax=Citrus sinensis TaxID=2711 RepID=A0A067DAX6_CITSI|nr:hypothetical protein CISIN_1g034830mg [Citrus sinensis]